MLKPGEAYNAVVCERESAPIRLESLEKVTVCGGMLRGLVGQLHLHTDGSLLVLAGLGVCQLNPDALSQLNPDALTQTGYMTPPVPGVG